MFVAEVGEPPHIAQAHCVAQAGEEEVTGIVPVASLLSLLPAVLHHAALCLLPHLETNQEHSLLLCTELHWTALCYLKLLVTTS